MAGKFLISKTRVSMVLKSTRDLIRLCFSDEKTNGLYLNPGVQYMMAESIISDYS